MPSMRWMRPLALALVVVFAGCVMPSGPQSDGSMIPESEPEATPAQTSLPPGVTSAGLENASALLAGHLASLRDAGYRLTQFTGGSQTTYVATANYSSYRIVPGPTASNPAVWANETATFAELTRDGETEYQQPPRLWASPSQMTGAETLRLLLEDGEFTTNGTRACADRRCTVLNATGSPRLENFTARALVHESGVVHQFHASYTRPDRNSTVPVEYHLVLTQRGNVDVSRPPWIETAVENT